MHEDIGAVFPAFFAFVDRAGPDAGVLVHCEAGVSRSATLVVALLMHTERLRFHDAYDRVRALRPQVLPNLGFATQLQRLEHSLFPEARAQHASLTRYLREVCKVPAEPAAIQAMLELHGYDGAEAIHAIFGEIPRVVQGVRR